ncbi:hypothetical protein [Streptomyces roseolus]|uniref:hypothetical protein n=1 Tax=Streptomyces roseolus TaxID=67358 RepID=UPI0037B44C5F
MGGATALDDVLRQAHVVRIGLVGGDGTDARVQVDLSDAVESARLRKAMAVEALPGFHCMCSGDVRFELTDRSGQRIAVVVLHHGETLRWERWESDAVLADGRSLLAWLDGHGMTAPLRQFEDDRRRADERAAQERDWMAAMPAGLGDTADRILDLSRTGGRPSPALLAELTERLRRSCPDPVERVLALLSWYGSGSGRCSGFPVHEGVPGELLRHVPITGLVAALLDPRARGRHDAGAVRHLVGRRSRPHQERDLAGLPEPLRARLPAHARGSSDPDKRGRAERWLVPGRG